jgi:DNA-dependent metalloprotease WSS1
MRDIDSNFGAYEHLSYLPRADEALHLIRRVASMVQPLMRKRNWKVGALSEFLPDDPNLQGLLRTGEPDLTRDDRS